MNKNFLFFGIVLFFVLSILWSAVYPASSAAPLPQALATAAPEWNGSIQFPLVFKQGGISDLQVITPRVAQFGKFEARFRLVTLAKDLNLPFTASPPPGLRPGTGISVDVLFTPDHWKTVYVQPAFFFQPFKHSTRNGKDHYTPDGPPAWAVRFTPQLAGLWEYRIRVHDARGAFIFPRESRTSLQMFVDEASRKGFLQVSRSDPRYFEFQDGTPFIGVGFNDSFSEVEQVEQKLLVYEQHKMNFMRVWMSEASINGSQWSSWGSHHLPMNGYLPATSFDMQTTYAGSDVSWRLDVKNPCLFADHWQGGIPVEPNTRYTVWARIKAEGIRGPASSGEFGFVIKQAGWLDKDCAKPGNGKLITRPVHGSTGWVTVSGSLTTGERQNWLDYLYLTLQNATDGKVNVDEVRVWRSNDPAQTNLLREPYANSHLHFDQLNSVRWDQFIESAERHGVYLKLVIDEKNEWIRNRLLANGEMNTEDTNDNFYGTEHSKVRWLHQAWWRYLIARWGYSTAIHSFEYVNEGDPNNGLHYAAASAMARYFDEKDPAQHMVTTSFWSSFPNAEFWSNQAYAEMDYADLHAYISTGWGQTATLLEKSRIETDVKNVRSAPASARLSGRDNDSKMITPRGLVLRGAGEWIVRYWMKAESFTADCPSGSQGGMQRVRWVLDEGDAQGIVPATSTGISHACTSPAGSFNWREFRSDRDRDGRPVPAEQRLILRDDQSHEFALHLENANGAGGTAWFDDIELISPWGEVVEVLGRFDTTPMDEDTAWYNHAYGDVFGAGAPTGARKPLVRGETGIDFPDQQAWNRDLIKDTGGVWLHNNVWGQINHTGMVDLFWWSQETIPQNLYVHFLTFRNFMEGILLNSGGYRDTAASTSSPSLRAWGQRDDALGQMHLWVQNTQHTWKRVVNGPAIQPVTGTITIPNVEKGRYRVEWWDTYAAGSPVFHTELLMSQGSLVLTLPLALTSDVAVKIIRE